VYDFLVDLNTGLGIFGAIATLFTMADMAYRRACAFKKNLFPAFPANSAGAGVRADYIT
jgi:hypothetical protein